MLVGLTCVVIMPSINQSLLGFHFRDTVSQHIEPLACTKRAATGCRERRAVSAMLRAGRRPYPSQSSLAGDYDRMISTEPADIDVSAHIAPDNHRARLQDILGEDFGDPEEIEDNAATSSMTLTELEQAALQIELRLVALRMQLDAIRETQHGMFPSQEGSRRSKYVSPGCEVRFILSCFTVGRLRGHISRLDRQCERYRRAADQRMKELYKAGVIVEEHLALEQAKGTHPVTALG